MQLSVVAGALLLFCDAALAGAGAGCVLPEVAVPIRNVDAVANVCISDIRRDPAALENLIYLRSYECSQAENARLAKLQLDCLFSSAATGASIMDAIGQNAFNTSDREISCSDAKRLAEDAVRLGNGRAAYVLAMAHVGGEFWGVCTEVNFRNAVKHLRIASDAGFSDAQAYYALLLIAIRDPKVLPLVGIDSPPDRSKGPYYFEEMAAEAGISPGEVSSSEIVALLELASQKRDDLAQKVLAAIYRNGIWVPRRRDLALAWLALRSPEYTDVNDRSDFAALYREVNGVTREEACAHIQSWTAANLNFRWYPGELKNSFVRQCMSKAAIVSTSECVSPATFRRLEKAIKSLVTEHPECAHIGGSQESAGHRSPPQ